MAAIQIHHLTSRFMENLDFTPRLQIFDEAPSGSVHYILIHEWDFILMSVYSYFYPDSRKGNVVRYCYWLLVNRAVILTGHSPQRNLWVHLLHNLLYFFHIAYLRRSAPQFYYSFSVTMASLIAKNLLRVPLGVNPASINYGKFTNFTILALRGWRKYLFLHNNLCYLTHLCRVLSPFLFKWFDLYKQLN